MTKWELIRVALTELNKQWNAGESCDCFDTSPDPGFESYDVSIKWNPQLNKDSKDHSNLPKAMTITRGRGGLFRCIIQDLSNPSMPPQHRQEKVIADICWYYFLTEMNTEFNALRKKIVEYKRIKENSSFLNDLVKVFPRTLDGALLGDDYDE